MAAGGQALSLLTDETLACQAQHGSRVSFEELARRFQVRLLRFLERRVHSVADAEDLLQETFVRAYQRLNRYDRSRSFATWLFTIAHRLAVSHHRRLAVGARVGAHLTDQARGSGNAPTSSGAQSRTAASQSPGELMEEAESRAMFWQCAQSVLTAEQFSAVWLFYVEEMPAPQIAEVLGRSWVSIKTTLFRARRKLLPHLAGYCEVQGSGGEAIAGVGDASGPTLMPG